VGAILLEGEDSSMKFGPVARAILAAAISPLSVMIAAPIILILMGLSHRWPIPLHITGILILSAYITIFAYGATIILGLPAYFLLRYFKIFSAWSAIISGIVIVILIPILSVLGATFTSSTDFAGSHGTENLRLLLSNPMRLFDPLMLLAPIVAISFWFIATPIDGSSTQVHK
jgi:hypothetical protein